MGIANNFRNAFNKVFGKSKDTKETSAPIVEDSIDLSDSFLAGIEDFVWVDAEKLNQEEKAERAKITDRLQNFALTERLAHSVAGAYGAPLRHGNEIIKIKERTDTDEIPYKVIKIQTQSSGLVGEILVPVDAKQSQNIYINWVGTYNLSTALADLERAPGEESYRNDEQNIIKQINQAVKSFHDISKEKSKIMISGHSLGGALAQQNFHSIQRSIATHLYEDNLQKGDVETCGKWIESEKNYRLALSAKEQHTHQELTADIRTHLTPKYIDSITLGAWNSAGVLKAVENSSNELAGIISESGVQQRALFGMVGGDAVQRTGEGSVLSNVSAEDAEVTLAKVDIGQEGFYKSLLLSLLGATTATASCMVLGVPAAILGGLAFGMLPLAKSTAIAHTACHFTAEDFDKIKCQLFQNDTPQSRQIIHQKLTNKSAFLQWSPVKTAQKGLHYLMSRFIDSKKAPIVETCLEQNEKNHQEQRTAGLTV